MGAMKVRASMTSTYIRMHTRIILTIYQTTTVATKGVDQLSNVVGKPQAGDVVGVHIRGYYIDKKKNKRKEYEYTWHKEKQYKFKIGAKQAIQGLETAVLDMQLGEEATVAITSDVGYGDQPHQGYTKVVPTHSALVMEVTLMKIIRDGTEHRRKYPKQYSTGC